MGEVDEPAADAGASAGAGGSSDAPPSDEEVEDASKAAEIDAALEELKKKLSAE